MCPDLIDSLYIFIMYIYINIYEIIEKFIVCHENLCFFTFASNACLKIRQRMLENLSDLPVSVAYRIVHFTRRASARPINLAENFTALQKRN